MPFQQQRAVRLNEGQTVVDEVRIWNDGQRTKLRNCITANIGLHVAAYAPSI